MGMQGAGFAAVGAVVAVLATAGCGGDDTSDSLARVAPADAWAYAELTLRPEGDDAADLGSLPGAPAARDALLQAVDADIAEQAAPRSDPPTYAADIEPWLGDRAAMVVSNAFREEIGDDATVIAETTDPDAAVDGMRALLENDGGQVTALDLDGVPAWRDLEGTTVAVVDDYALLGPEFGVEEIVAVINGDDEPLADADDFTFDVAGVDGSEEFGFVWLDAEGLYGEPDEEDLDEADALADSIGLDRREPITGALIVEGSEIRFDYSVGISDEYEVGTGDELGALPGDATAAISCGICLRALAMSFEEGLLENAEEDGLSADQGSGVIDSFYGTTPTELFDAVGVPAAFVRPTGSSVGAAMVLPVSDPAPVRTALENIPRVFAFIDEDGVRARGLPPDLAGEAVGFRVRGPEVPDEMAFASDDERVVVALGDASLRSALAPETTLAESGRLESVASLDGYDPTLLVDPAGVLDLVATVDPNSEVSLSQARPYLEGISAMLGGSRVDEDHLLGRVVVSFEK